MSISGEDRYAERPNRFPLPPIILIGSLALGYGLHTVSPIGLPAPGIAKVIGALALAAGVVLVMSASMTLSRSGTAVLPHHPATRLVTSGPFAWSRNPIYLGEVLIVAGFGGVENALAYVVAAAILVAALSHFAVKREEAHLAARFGEAWQAYSARVRRWL